MPPSVAIHFFFPGTTRTTVGGVVSSLDKDSSDEEDSSPLLALLGEPVTSSCFVSSRVIPPLLWDPTLLSFFYSDVLPEASAGVDPGRCLFLYSAAFATIFAPLLVPRGLQAFPSHSA